MKAILNNRQWTIEFVLGFGLWLFGTVFFSHFWILLIPFIMMYISFRRNGSDGRKVLSNVSKVHVFFVVSIVFFSLANDVFNGHSYCHWWEFVQPYHIWPLVIVMGHLWGSESMSKGWIWGVVFEILVGVGQKLLGVSSIDLQPQMENSTLWYNCRVDGLSASSSVFGLKIFLSFLVLTVTPFSQKWKIFFGWCLLVGVWITFNRSVVIAIFVFGCVLMMRDIFKYRLKFRDWDNSLPILFIFSFLILVFSLSVFQGTNQLNRGGLKEDFNYGNASAKDSLNLTFDDFPMTCDQMQAYPLVQQNELDTSALSFQWMKSMTDGINTSGRNLIWLNYFQFIEGHFHFGNGSQKLWMRSVNANKMKISVMHAHNSWLQLLATNGFWISIMYVAYYCWMWRRGHIAHLSAIMVYSFFQFGWGWGFSVLDFLLVYFLITPEKK